MNIRLRQYLYYLIWVGNALTCGMALYLFAFPAHSLLTMPWAEYSVWNHWVPTLIWVGYTGIAAYHTFRCLRVTDEQTLKPVFLWYWFLGPFVGSMLMQMS